MAKKSKASKTATIGGTTYTSVPMKRDRSNYPYTNTDRSLTLEEVQKILRACGIDETFLEPDAMPLKSYAVFVKEDGSVFVWVKGDNHTHLFPVYRSGRPCRGIFGTIGDFVDPVVLGATRMAMGL